MADTLRFRLLLPVVETVSAGIFGGVGLWQRHQILNQRLWGNETLWNSTARFHVWPRPFRFAVVTNIPAFLLGGLTEWPLSKVWPDMPEVVGYSFAIIYGAAMWCWIGSRLDTVQRTMPSNATKVWKILLAFTVSCALGVFTPGYIGYVYYGVLLWVVFAVVLMRSWKSSTSLNPTDFASPRT